MKSFETFVKKDSTKPKWSLLPMDVVGEIVKVLTWALGRYPRDNWKNAKGKTRKDFVDALYRHLAEFTLDPYSKDSESGYLHIIHAGTNIIFLIWFTLNGGFEDESDTYTK